MCRLGLAAYIYPLEGTTTYTYLSYAALSFSDHSLMSPIQVAQSIISTLFLCSLSKFTYFKVG